MEDPVTLNLKVAVEVEVVVGKEDEEDLAEVKEGVDGFFLVQLYPCELAACFILINTALANVLICTFVVAFLNCDTALPALVFFNKSIVMGMEDMLFNISRIVISFGSFVFALRNACVNCSKSSAARAIFVYTKLEI